MHFAELSEVLDATEAHRKVIAILDVHSSSVRHFQQCSFCMENHP